MEAGYRSTDFSGCRGNARFRWRPRLYGESYTLPRCRLLKWLLLAEVYEELIRQAAQGEVVYNDDTTVKILELMGERAEKSPPADDPHDPDRTGLFTSGVVATRAGVRVALFFSGRQHAGGNLSDVLKHRAAELDTPIQICDGLARNLPKELDTILANCLAHSRRKFVDLYDRFSDECECDRGCQGHLLQRQGSRRTGHVFRRAIVVSPGPEPPNHGQFEGLATAPIR